MKRGSLLFVMLLSLLLSIGTVVKAAPEGHLIFVALNDKLLTFPDAEPEVQAGTTYVPVSQLAQAMGGQVTWNAAEQTVDLVRGEQAVQLDLNHQLLLDKQGASRPLTLYLKSDRTMVPVRAIGAEFGYQASYIAEGPIARVSDADAKLSDQELFQKYKDYIAEEKAKHSAPKPQPQPQPKPEPDKVVYLTFDDGPTSYTKSILTTLQNEGVHATFFMLEPGIKAYPEDVKQMKQDGHSLGLHGVTHDYHLIYRSPQTMIDEMEQDNKALYDAVGVRSSIVRMPYGSKPWLNQSYLDALYSSGYHLWDWNVDSTDSSAPNVPAATILSQVEQQTRGMKRAVILMHDHKTTAEALPQIIDYLKKQGFAFEKIYGSTKPVNFWNDER